MRRDRMNPKMIFRISMDLLTTIFLLLLMVKQCTGDPSHE